MSLAAEAQPGAPTFLDSLIEKLALKNDADLARAFEVAPPVISKIRHRKLPFGDSMILKTHEKFGIAVADIRAGLAGKAQ